MPQDPTDGTCGTTDRSDAGEDLFGKLDSLIQENRLRATHPSVGCAPMLTEPVDEGPTEIRVQIPVLEDALNSVVAGDPILSRLMADKRRQLQVALYLRLRQCLDRELEAALADNQRLVADAVHPAFARAAAELRAVLPIVVRESVEQVFRLEVLEALIDRAGSRGRTDG